MVQCLIKIYILKKNKQLLLKKRPVGIPTKETWALTEVNIPQPNDGEFLMKCEYISLDPAMRGWLNDVKSYIPPVQINEVMRAGGVGKIIASNHKYFKEGDYVYGQTGVQQYVVSDGKGYHNDLKQAILKGKLNFPVLTMPADLPALTGKFIDKIIGIFEKKGKNALAVFVPLEKREKLELSVSSKDEYEGVLYAVSGVNIINGKKILSEGKIETAAYITDEIEVLFNINTKKDLDIAEKNLKKLMKNQFVCFFEKRD